MVLLLLLFLLLLVVVVAVVVLQRRCGIGSHEGVRLLAGDHFFVYINSACGSRLQFPLTIRNMSRNFRVELNRSPEYAADMTIR